MELVAEFIGGEPSPLNFLLSGRYVTRVSSNQSVNYHQELTKHMQIQEWAPGVTECLI